MRHFLLVSQFFLAMSAYAGINLTPLLEVQNEQFYELSTITAQSGQVYVLDKGAIQVFQLSDNGSLDDSLGRQGQGPGEFLEPTDLIVVGDTLYVLEHKLMKVSRFVGNQFDKEFRLEMMPFSFMEFRSYFYVVDLFSEAFVRMYDRDFDPVYAWPPVGVPDDISEDNPMVLLFSKLSYWTASKDWLFATYMYNPVVEKYSPKLELQRSTPIHKGLKARSVTTKGNSAFVDGEEIVKEIDYAGGRIYVLWMKQGLDQIECEGYATISLFDENLEKIGEVTPPDCLIKFCVENNILYGVCEEPEPKIVMYRIGVN